MFRDPLHALKNQVVVVKANGMTYKGKLIEVTPTYVLIRRQNGFAQINMNQVQGITSANQADPALKQVPGDYFSFPEEPASTPQGGENNTQSKKD